MRAALGAGRWRIVRQMLADAFVLTALGACAGVALAWIGIRELRAIAPANLPRLDAIGIDPTVLGFTAAIALAVAVLFGMVPAWSAFRMDLMTVLRGSGRTAGLSAGRTFRNAVVVAEVALCFVLLIGSGLMFRSFLELQRIDPGFDPRGLLTFQLLGGRPGPPAQRAELARQIEERLRAIPGVERVTASFPFPLAGDFSTIRWGPRRRWPTTRSTRRSTGRSFDRATSTRCARACWRAGPSPRPIAIPDEIWWSWIRCWRRRRSRTNPRSASAS